MQGHKTEPGDNSQVCSGDGRGRHCLPARGPNTLLANFLFSSSAMESLSFRSNCHGGMRTVSTISTRTNILRRTLGTREPVNHGGLRAMGVPEPPRSPRSLGPARPAAGRPRGRAWGAASGGRVSAPLETEARSLQPPTYPQVRGRPVPLRPHPAQQPRTIHAHPAAPKTQRRASESESPSFRRTDQ